MFAEAANMNINYLVFVEPEGDCNGMYVTAKTATSFIVKELMQGTSNTSFSYRVAAKRKGFENLNMPTYQENEQANQQYTQAVWPEVIQNATTEHQSIVSKINAKVPQLFNPPSYTQTPIVPTTVLHPDASSTNSSQDIPALQENNPHYEPPLDNN
jgi:hypothetical protein